MTAPVERAGPSRRARRWATFIAIPGIIIMLALGAWQTQRLTWKASEQAYRDARLAEEPIPLPTTVDDPAELFYRRVIVEGTLQHDKEMFLGARSHKGGLGFQVITLLLRADGSAILFNRGWVPLERKEPRHRRAGQIEGPQRLEGLVVPGGKDAWFAPGNLPAERLWYWVDLESISAVAGIPTQTFVVDAGPAENPGGFPIGGQTHVKLRNEHLSYVITWFCLAIGLAVIYVIFMRGRPKKPANAATPP